jgi:hypothetical protein
MIDLTALEGRWTLLRAIRHADGACARLRGTAVWHREGDALRCVETGRLEQDGQGWEARRETFWRAGTAGIEVSFADGRPFHLLDASGRAEHACPPDTYRLRYDVSAWPRWSVRWDVTGPRKSYRALTRHAPVGAPPLTGGGAGRITPR